MDRGKIVLACPGSGGTRDRLVANLLLFDLLHAARGRADLPPEQRKPFWVFLDEVQSYDGAASGNLAALLEQSAKFGLRAVLLNQNPERLSAATLNALTTNRSHLLASTLNSHAAALVTKEWGRRVSPEALTKLERFRFIAQVTHKGRLSAPFALGGVRVEDVLGEPAADDGPNERATPPRRSDRRRRSPRISTASTTASSRRCETARASGDARHAEGRERPRAQRPGPHREEAR